MSLQQLKPVVPCSICKKVMVPLGPMGDTGKKKCEKCKYKLRGKKTARDWYRRKHQKTCIRCGADVTFTAIRKRTEICVDCEMKISEQYHTIYNCIYCGRLCPRPRIHFCSHNCRVKARYILNGRNRKSKGHMK